ncbi:heterokaryon incompatibility protein-domain-containing protein [Xylariaceae sp. FL1272]|nr:heterokaryon incompatibility protein-domain-containing protein [Xylariaceae sp. FL1272]
MEGDIDKILNSRNGFRHVCIDARSQFRLLRSQREQSSLARYSLEVVPITDLENMEYRALSYTWGRVCDPSDVRAIEVDGHPFFVRRNLYDFLQTAAAKNEHGLFFIDALCINQNDVTERQLQVAMMPQIYRRANSLIVWLGRPEGVEMEDVRSLAQASRHSCSSWDVAQWRGLKYLSYHDYWRRVWVVQEVLLARELTIWCGFFSFPASLLAMSSFGARHDYDRTMTVDQNGRPNVFADASTRCQSPAERIITDRTRYLIRQKRDELAQGTRIGTLEEMTRVLKRPSTEVVTYQSPIMDPLYRVVRRFGKLECSDPRDKLYGFLGIMHERTRGLVKLDYTKGVDYAYHQALSIGLQEIYGEEGSIVYVSHSKDRRLPYLSFYCEARDAFGIEDGLSVRILRTVLKELRFRLRAENVVLELQKRHQFAWRDDELRLSPDLRQLFEICKLDEEEPGHDLERRSRLFRFHRRQSEWGNKIRVLSHRAVSRSEMADSRVGKVLFDTVLAS